MLGLGGGGDRGLIRLMSFMVGVLVEVLLLLVRRCAGHWLGWRRGRCRRRRGQRGGVAGWLAEEASGVESGEIRAKFEK